MNEENRIDIEVKLAHHEKAIKDMSQVIYDQQRKIDALEKTLKRLQEQVKAYSERAAEEDVINEKPPHY